MLLGGTLGGLGVYIGTLSFKLFLELSGLRLGGGGGLEQQV